MKKVYSYSLLVVVLMSSKCFGGVSYFIFSSQVDQQVEAQRIVEFWSNVAFDFNDVPAIVNSFYENSRHYLEERELNAGRILGNVGGLEGEWALSKERIMLNHSDVYSLVQADYHSSAIARMLYFFPLMVMQNVLRKLQNQHFYGKGLERNLPGQREMFRQLLEESRRFAGVLLLNLPQ